MNEPARRVCIVGDELVAGAGDPKGLGWVGRVVGRTTADPLPVVMTLAVPGETTTALVGRWEAEVLRRLDPDTDHPAHLVIALGRADLRAGISTARSRLNLANVLDVAEQRRITTFVVGPPPGRDSDPAAQAEFSAALADVSQRRGVPFVDTYRPLENHEQWLADLAAGDGRVPGQAGYGLLAWLVLHAGWARWLGAEQS